MAIVLETFSLLRAPGQGLTMNRLTSDKQVKTWLPVQRPQTAERYRDRIHAIYNVGRLAVSSDMDAMIIRRHGAAKGLATILYDQEISDPEGRSISGNHIDYWIIPGQNHLVRRAVAEAVINQVQALRPNQPYFATITQGEHSGLKDVMKPSGAPTVYHTAEGATLEGALEGEPSQLYVPAKGHLTALSN